MEKYFQKNKKREIIKIVVFPLSKSPDALTSEIPSGFLPERGRESLSLDGSGQVAILRQTWILFHFRGCLLNLLNCLRLLGAAWNWFNFVFKMIYIFWLYKNREEKYENMGFMAYIFKYWWNYHSNYLPNRYILWNCTSWWVPKVRFQISFSIFGA